MTNGTTVTARVCRGRTVMIADPSTRTISGYRQDGSTITRPIEKAFGPGELVTLSAEDAEHLHRTGFVQDPAAPIAASIVPRDPNMPGLIGTEAR